MREGSRSSCARALLPIGEYPPARVKRTVAGNGRAEKIQVANMVKVILGLGELPAPDAADALAVAVTHLQASPLLRAAAQESLPRSRPVGAGRARFHIR